MPEASRSNPPTTGTPDTGTLPFTAADAGVLVSVRLTPKAAADRIAGVERLADGSVVLKVAVTAVPEKGKANKALLKLLSKSWGVGMRSLDLIRGSKDRYKTVLVSRDTEATLRALNAWARELGPPS